MSDAAQQPWERQEREGDNAWAAFQLWRDAQGARTAVSVARAVGCTRQAVSKWRRRNDWDARCLAYDRHLDAKARQVHEDEYLERLEAFRRRQISVAAGATNTAIHGLAIVSAKVAQLREAVDAKSDKLLLGDVLEIGRACALLARLGIEAEASALSVEDLVKQMRRQEDEDEQ